MTALNLPSDSPIRCTASQVFSECFKRGLGQWNDRHESATENCFHPSGPYSLLKITIGGYTFDGPFAGTDKIEDRSGVYAILCYHEQKYFVVDVGESATLKTRAENHDRKESWKRNCTGTLMVATLYTPHLQQAGRTEIEQKIRDEYAPPCGKR